MSLTRPGLGQVLENFVPEIDNCKKINSRGEWPGYVTPTSFIFTKISSQVLIKFQDFSSFRELIPQFINFLNAFEILGNRSVLIDPI